MWEVLAVIPCSQRGVAFQSLPSGKRSPQFAMTGSASPGKQFETEALLVALGGRSNVAALRLEDSCVRLNEHGQLLVNGNFRSRAEEVGRCAGNPSSFGDQEGTAHRGPADGLGTGIAQAIAGPRCPLSRYFLPVKNSLTFSPLNLAPSTTV